MQHSNPMPPELVPYLGALLAVCALGCAYVYFSSNVKRKRIVLPLTFVAIGCSFVAMTWPLRRQMPWFFLAIILGSLALQYRSIKFCPRCGATSRGSLFKPLHFCSKCGAALAGGS